MDRKRTYNYFVINYYIQPTEIVLEYTLRIMVKIK